MSLTEPKKKMGCKKQMDNSWAPRKKNKWGIVKKIGYLGYKEKKCNISKTVYF